MGSALRTNIFNIVQTRLTNLGHTLNAGEIWAIVNDVESQIAVDASAQADALADIGQFPVDPAQTT
jgi:hypothetical protein